MSAPESAKPVDVLSWLSDDDFLIAAAIILDDTRPDIAGRLRNIADRASQRQPETRDERAAKAEAIVGAIALALANGHAATLILDENSPIREAIRDYLASPQDRNG